MTQPKTIREVARACHENSIAHGWWEGMRRGPDQPVDASLAVATVPEKLVLIHSEVSEALEEYRTLPAGVLRQGETHAGGKPVGFDSELADVVIRVFDLAESLGIDIERAILAKHAYNITRPHRHGGKAI